MNCATVDELAAAYALGGVDAAEERDIAAHLDTCPEPHGEARDLIGAAAFVAAASEPVAPSPLLRDRLMATVGATAQDHRPLALPPSHRGLTAVPRAEPAAWRRALAPLALAAAVMAAAILGVWNINLGQQVAERDQAIHAIASADAVHQVTGSAGTGLLLQEGGTATFVAEGLADLPAGHLYELWLIGADGSPVAVGTFVDDDGVALVALEHDIGAATTFAVTVEAQRVDAPTTDPVLVASLEG